MEFKTAHTSTGDDEGDLSYLTDSGPNSGKKNKKSKKLRLSKPVRTEKYDGGEMDEIAVVLSTGIKRKHLVPIAINNQRTFTLSKTVCYGKNC